MPDVFNPVGFLDYPQAILFMAWSLVLGTIRFGGMICPNIAVFVAIGMMRRGVRGARKCSLFSEDWCFCEVLA